MSINSSSSRPVRAAVAQLRKNPTTRVLIIGGGINGIATFRDLALQGIEVVLVERGDFVSGASSASSHMVHGGIRYLENGEFRLVRESVTERNALLKLAPHYVRPLETTVPIFSTFSGILGAPLRFLTHKQGKPRERGALLIKVGLTIYDTFSRDGGSVPRHRFRRRARALFDLPRLNPRIRYSATYFDASMHDPERLALDVLHDGLAVGAHARAANYLEVVAANADGVVVRDHESGATFTIAAEVVVNATGPWADLTNSLLGNPSSFMGGTKGSHIVLDNAELLEATKGREIFFEHSDGRIVLIYPLKGRVLVGTTDVEADPAVPTVTTDDDIAYFFELVRHVFPDVAVDASQIVYSFSGIRPLPRHDDTHPGFVSRDYRIVAGAIGRMPLLSLVGGKWTTFRALAESLTNQVLGLLAAPRVTTTKELPIGGGKGFPTSESDRDAWLATHFVGVETQRAADLLDRYGTRATEFAPSLVASDPPLVEAPGYSRAEIMHIAGTEHVVHLVDLVLRRTSLAFVGALNVALLDELADVVGESLGWDRARRAREVELTEAELRQAHGVYLRDRRSSVPAD